MSWHQAYSVGSISIRKLMLAGVTKDTHWDKQGVWKESKTLLWMKFYKYPIVCLCIVYCVYTHRAESLSVGVRETRLQTEPVPWPTPALIQPCPQPLPDGRTLIWAVERRNKEMSSTDYTYNSYSFSILISHLTKLKSFGHKVWQGNLFIIHKKLTLTHLLFL